MGLCVEHQWAGGNDDGSDEEDYNDGDFITIIPSTVGKGDRYEQLYILKAA